jgi:hypothetical protein
MNFLKERWIAIAFGIIVLVVVLAVIRKQLAKLTVKGQIVKGTIDKSDVRQDFTEAEIARIAEEFHSAFDSWLGGDLWTTSLGSPPTDSILDKLSALSDSEFTLVNNWYNTHYNYSFIEMVRDATGGWTVSSDKKDHFLRRAADLGITK